VGGWFGGIMGEKLRKAVFLDRDNTLIADPGYINSPDLVELLPGAASAVRRLNEAGFVVVVATNQSGVARGLITEAQLGEVHERLRELMLEQGARLDAIYACPYLAGPEAVVAEYCQVSPLRKPAPGMLLLAAEELGLDLTESWMIGDSARDAEAGRAAGCRTILVGAAEAGHAAADFVAGGLAEAVELVIADRRPVRAAAAGAAVSSPAVDRPAAPDALELLTEIRDMLRRRERATQHEDFSVARLLGTLTQMLALVVAAWGIAALFGRTELAASRFGLAIFLQLAALTAFLSDRK
jgi:D-glycero-D-manno-heptose 1,7-bisphosphate phosphatase